MTNIVFFGTKPLGERILLLLLERGANIVAVVTKEGGHGWWGKTEIEEIAMKEDIPLYNDHHDLPDASYDVGISILYFKIIDKKTN
jgi:methionyl-tRNA formyltransferase